MVTPPELAPSGPVSHFSRRKFASATAASYGAVLAQVLGGVVVLPIGIAFFGATKFGIWLTLSSLSTYLANGNLGVPLATMTAVSHATSKAEEEDTIVAALRILCTATLILSAALGVGWGLYPGWTRTLFGPAGNLHEVHVTAAIAIFGTLLVLPLTIFPAVLGGLQRVTAQKLFLGLTFGLKAITMFIVVALHGSLVMLAMLAVAGDLAVSLSALLYLRWRENLQLSAAKRDHFDRRPLLSSSLRFFALQIEAAVIANTDNLIISVGVGPSAVAYYAATYKAIQLCGALLNAIQGPLWPAYGRASSLGDWDWIDRTYGRTVAFTLASMGTISLFSVAVMPYLLLLWLGPDAPIDRTLILILAGYSYVGSYAFVNSTILNSLDKTTSQVVSGGVEAVLNVIISITLVGRLGVRGVALGTLIGSFAVGAWFLPIDLTRKSQGRTKCSLKHASASAAYTAMCVGLVFIAMTPPLSAAKFSLAGVGCAFYLAATYYQHGHTLAGRSLPYSRGAS